MSYIIDLMIENVYKAFEKGLITEKECDEAIDNLIEFSESEN